MTYRLSLFLVIDTLVAVASGVCSNLLLKLSASNSFLVGLLFFVGGELFVLLLESKAARSDREALLAFVRAFDAHTEFSRFYLTLLIERIQSGMKGLLRDGIQIAPGDVPKIWTECIAHCDASLTATSYVEPATWWQKTYSSPALDLRKVKARQNKAMRTLFLWDTVSELAELEANAKDQRSAGITVTHFPCRNLYSDARRVAKLKIIGTPDFSVIDGKWAFLHFLDTHRRTKGALLTDAVETVAACNELVAMTPGEPDFTHAGSGT